MEGNLRTVEDIKHSIMFNVLRIVNTLHFSWSISSAQADALQWFNIHPVVNIKVPFPVKWLRPQHNYCLNVDGAFKGSTGICGGGGCFRDSRDSALLVGAIHSGRCPHWSVFPWWKGICNMVDHLKPIIQHSFREGNQVADCLANHACAQADNTVYSDFILLPPSARGFWPKATLASTLGRLSGVSVQTWTPTLTPTSSDMDANFSDLHALQSQKIREQGMASIGGCPLTALSLSNRHGEWVRGSPKP
ncbi:hypothetical protein Taro_040423 [Colocasia esculenta]|uniref:RNase H type-1 domain-containing protein n=1 Tax=Colocasia esculenta TaxID=4460 RepID=A0A843WT03_COLES|nr:hypothetical protein [Colocasia esculenta]